MRFRKCIFLHKKNYAKIDVFFKDSFLRALREVALEMELFLENHGKYMKNFVIELIYMQSCTFRHFSKKLYLEEYD